MENIGTGKVDVQEETESEMVIMWVHIICIPYRSNSLRQHVKPILMGLQST